MFDQFFDFYFSYVNSLLYAGVNAIGIFASLLLLRKTRNHGPLMVFSASIIKLLVGLSFPISNLLEKRNGTDYEVMQRVWLSLSLFDLIGTAILLIGMVLIAKDFRAFLDAVRLQEDFAKDSNSS